MKVDSTPLFILFLYLGKGTSDIQNRSMLQARTGRWVEGTSWGGWVGIPLLTSTSTISCSLESHWLGSPNNTTATLQGNIELTWVVEYIVLVCTGILYNHYDIHRKIQSVFYWFKIKKKMINI